MNATDRFKSTPLHWAAGAGSVEAVEVLVNAKANLHAFSPVMHTPLASAAGAGKVDTLKKLVAAGADVNCQEGLTDIDRQRAITALQYASMENQVEAIKVLVKLGAELNNADFLPLHMAAGPEVAKVLIESGADVNQLNSQGLSALHVAASGEKVNPILVKLLAERMADLNLQDAAGNTALHYAVMRRHTNLVVYLTTIGADTKIENKGGESPPAMAKRLGVTLQGVPGAKLVGSKPLERAIRKGDMAQVKQLIAQGLKVNVSDGSTSPLHVASEIGSAAIATLLLEKGANVESRDSRVKRPLHYAANAQTAEVLIKSGADVSEESDSVEPPIYTALEAGRTDVVKVLIHHGVGLHPTEEESPLTWAVFFLGKLTASVLCSRRVPNRTGSARSSGKRLCWL